MLCSSAARPPVSRVKCASEINFHRSDERTLTVTVRQHTCLHTYRTTHTPSAADLMLMVWMHVVPTARIHFSPCVKIQITHFILPDINHMRYNFTQCGTFKPGFYLGHETLGHGAALQEARKRSGDNVLKEQFTQSEVKCCSPQNSSGASQ